MSFDGDDPSALKAWLEQNGPIESIQAVICDLNGIMRGKRVPVEQASKVLGGGIRMPLSIVGVDVWGEDIIGSEQVFATGDRDGICGVTGRGPCRSTGRRVRARLCRFGFSSKRASRSWPIRVRRSRR